MTRRSSACWFCVPYPVGRKTRANATEPSDALAADDVFEVLIDPRDDQGRSKGPVYRVVGNAGGVCKIDRDLPQIGQPHQPWQAGVKCGSMMWDPMGSWMAAVQIPFHDLGGPPKDGDAWGFQAAIRYADPKITAVLSPSDDFSDRSRFARVRFDAGRRANYRCHWLSEDEIKHGTFCVGGIFSNGGNEPAWFDGRVTLYRGDRPLGQRNLCPRGQAALQVRRRHGAMPLPLAAVGPPRARHGRPHRRHRPPGKVYRLRPVCAVLADGARRARLAEAAFRQGIHFSSRPVSVVRRDRLCDRLPDAHGGPARGRTGHGDRCAGGREVGAARACRFRKTANLPAPSASAK